ncbi:MAG: hypothetical protein SWJ54_13655 [Cyanobacteriota bacterium]|nr:hypothetical protein [Cyanobacteriota bacterium]
MTTHFIEAEIDLNESPQQLHKEIETELQKRGTPLRWAITSVDEQQQKVQVEAVVTTEETSTPATAK